MRMRTWRSPSRGSRWRSEARSTAARSMMELTRRMVGADWLSSSESSRVEVKRLSEPTICSAALAPASERMSSMARAAPSLP